MSGSVLFSVASQASSNGWTTFNPTFTGGNTLLSQQAGSGYAGTGTRIIYVSSSTGNDTTGNGTQGNPYATIAKGLTFIRDGKPDWLLLKCGDTFTNDTIASGLLSGPGMVVSPAWSVPGDHTVSGIILFGYYGTGARPLIQSSVAHIGAGGAIIEHTGSDTFSNVFINGWEFYAYTRDPANGSFVSADANASLDCIDIFVPGSNFYMEDCKFSFFSYGLTLECLNGIWSNWGMRRCILVDSYIGGGNKSQGMFVSTFQNGLLEECVFDNNGWNATVTGADQNLLNHNVYIAIIGNTENIIRGNIFARDAGGAQFRSGGTLYNNLFVQSAPNLVMSVNKVSITYNVIQEATDRTGANAATLGWGYEINFCLPNALVDHNIISNETSSGGFGIQLDDPTQWLGGTPTATFNGTTTVTNVFNNGVGAGNGLDVGGWPVGTPVSGPLIPANTTVVSASGFDGSGTAGTLVLSNAATGSGTNNVYRPIVNCTISNNIIYKQVGGIVDNGTGTTLTNNCNDPTGTNSGQPGEPFPSPTRTLGSYDTTLGGPGTTTHFLTLARGQSKANWNSAYMANAANNYIRAGFNLPQL